ncbi:MAG TPA: M23 family metallopeptidase [Thermoflexia bacterium]|nr:M23 family metallopeptidase [Thermoflexia bacterium]
MIRHQVKRAIFWGICGVVLLSLAVLAGWLLLRHYRGSGTGGPLLPALVATQSAELATTFTYPLDPERLAPYIPQQSGPLDVDTRFDVQNPGLGDRGKCFVNHAGQQLPFSQLWHAGEDWFVHDADGKVQWGHAAGEPVQAVANGVVSWAQNLGGEGNVLIVEHHLPHGERVWSVYWHLAGVRVAVGEAITRGQALGVIHDRGLNSHLHWEIRTFATATELFPLDSAGGRGQCNGYVMGVGYTWDDDPARAHPGYWGYLHPSEFVSSEPLVPLPRSDQSGNRAPATIKSRPVLRETRAPHR